ncbi:peptidylprolyl isomerase [Pontibacter sp. E15-1]|uniref:peptidylprolyl isomerase n=1 Tax=Pontibacter sp. E15-1 TaxID=2919918 RepID=UPI001F4FB2BE|nr:peptidylprolyl isomerase [Pontibacter sp. E15-1]MCJ8167225.1 peptidylprolyl isomerase [Pontibacter sp. E15-1]
MIKKQFLAVGLRTVLVAACLATAASCNPTASDNGTDATENVADEDERKLRPLTSENAVEVLRAYGQKHPDSLVTIMTRHGTIKLRLYHDTPLHRANFIRLTKAGFYNEGEFYRVVKDFAVQGGDSDERKMRQGSYKIPQEFNPGHIHKRGALAMARYGDERNPEKESSSHNFYIVTGKPVGLDELRAYEAQHNMQYTPEQIQTYLAVGGAPGLDTEYTVFGELVEGMDVVAQIEQEPVDGTNWPRRVVPHVVKVVKE